MSRIGGSAEAPGRVTGTLLDSLQHHLLPPPDALLAPTACDLLARSTSLTSRLSDLLTSSPHTFQQQLPALLSFVASITTRLQTSRQEAEDCIRALLLLDEAVSPFFAREPRLHAEHAEWVAAVDGGGAVSSEGVQGWRAAAVRRRLSYETLLDRFSKIMTAYSPWTTLAEIPFGLAKRSTAATTMSAFISLAQAAARLGREDKRFGRELSRDEVGQRWNGVIKRLDSRGPWGKTRLEEERKALQDRDVGDLSLTAQANPSAPSTSGSRAGSSASQTACSAATPRSPSGLAELGSHDQPAQGVASATARSRGQPAEGVAASASTSASTSANAALSSGRTSSRSPVSVEGDVDALGIPPMPKQVRSTRSNNPLYAESRAPAGKRRARPPPLDTTSTDAAATIDAAAASDGAKKRKLTSPLVDVPEKRELVASQEGAARSDESVHVESPSANGDEQGGNAATGASARGVARPSGSSRFDVRDKEQVPESPLMYPSPRGAGSRRSGLSVPPFPATDASSEGEGHEEGAEEDVSSDVGIEAEATEAGSPSRRRHRRSPASPPSASKVACSDGSEGDVPSSVPSSYAGHLASVRKGKGSGRLSPLSSWQSAAAGSSALDLPIFPGDVRLSPTSLSFHRLARLADSPASFLTAAERSAAGLPPRDDTLQQLAQLSRIQQADLVLLGQERHAVEALAAQKQQKDRERTTATRQTTLASQGVQLAWALVEAGGVIDGFCKTGDHEQDAASLFALGKNFSIHPPAPPPTSRSSSRSPSPVQTASAPLVDAAYRASSPVEPAAERLSKNLGKAPQPRAHLSQSPSAFDASIASDHGSALHAQASVSSPPPPPPPPLRPLHAPFFSVESTLVSPPLSLTLSILSAAANSEYLVDELDELDNEEEDHWKSVKGRVKHGLTLYLDDTESHTMLSDPSLRGIGLAPFDHLDRLQSTCEAAIIAKRAALVDERTALPADDAWEQRRVKVMWDGWRFTESGAAELWEGNSKKTIQQLWAVYNDENPDREKRKRRKMRAGIDYGEY
ncbi:hypothetical protein JCM11251_004813 [Rhodosporidiobolus azoricus]